MSELFMYLFALGAVSLDHVSWIFPIMLIPIMAGIVLIVTLHNDEQEQKLLALTAVLLYHNRVLGWNEAKQTEGMVKVKAMVADHEEYREAA
jgi:hypothetical protein